MDRELLEREIAELERRLEETKASKPAHDSSGAHAMRQLEIEDELDERKRALQDERRRGETNSSHQKGKHR